MRRQHIVETVTCDQCDAESTETTTYTVEIATKGAPLRRTLDLCPEHALALDELLATMRKLPGPGRVVSIGIVACPVCDAQVANAAMSQHLIAKHGATAPQPARCPDCDAPPHSSATALIAHRKHQHGYEHRAALLASLNTSPKRRRAR